MPATPIEAPGGRSVARSLLGSLGHVGYGAITTEIEPAPTFYFAEDYHQQYLDKHPRG